MNLYQNKDWLYQQYWGLGLSTPEIARKLHCGKTTVHAWLKKHNIKIRSVGEGQRGKKKQACSEQHKKILSQKMIAYRAKFLEPKPYHNREWLYQKYIVEKLSPYKIAKLCDDYGARIWHWITKFGLSTRNRSSAIKEHFKQNPDASLKGERNPQYGVKRSDEYKQYRREKSLANWKNPEYLAKCLRGYAERPTRPEQIIAAMFPGSIRYVGNRTFWRVLPNGKYKNPDFKVIHQDKVIEVFGDHWHKNDNPSELVSLYKQAGLDCLVIWEHEIYQQPKIVKENIGQFLGAV